MKTILLLSTVLFIVGIFVESESATIHISLDGRNDSKVRIQNGMINQELELEIIEEDNDVINFGKTNKADKSQKVQPPEYLRLIFNRLSQTENDRSNDLEHSSGPIIRAWLPVDISRGDDDLTTAVKFQQTVNREKFGNFIKAHIILTLREEIDKSSNNFIVNLLLSNEETRSQMLGEKSLFYDFDITMFLKRKLVSKTEHPEYIFFDFSIFNKQDDANVSFLEDLFDVQVDRPFILLQYQNLPDSIFIDSINSISGQHDTSRRGNRERRAVESNPIIQIEAGDTTNHLTTTGDNISDVTGNSSHRHRTISVSAINRKVTIPKLVTSTNYDKQEIFPNPPPIIIGNTTIFPTPSMEPPGQNFCKKYEWLAKPVDVGWNDIIYPKYLDLGYCAGDCPFPLMTEYFNFTLHAFFMDRQRQRQAIDIPKNFPFSSCVPVSYKEIMVMKKESDENGFSVDIYEGASVAACGCR